MENLDPILSAVERADFLLSEVEGSVRIVQLYKYDMDPVKAHRKLDEARTLLLGAMSRLDAEIAGG